MDRQGNTYTLLYSIILVVVVAALLAVVSLSLQPLQNENKQNEKRQNILSAIHVTSSAETASKDFNQYIKEQYVVNSKGEQSEGDAFDIDVAGEYAKPADQRQLPVFVAEVDGAKKYILPVYGAGLWGPIWGYIALNEDKNTVFGAFFDHSGETPGLGAEISTSAHHALYVGKKIFDDSGKFVSVALKKGGTNPNDPNYAHEVDAITGGTKTSDGVTAMLHDCLENYLPYIDANKAANSNMSNN